MDLVINFIGIILLYQTVIAPPYSYTIYLPDGRSHPAACGTPIPEHYAFIRVMGRNVSAIKWPYIPCPSAGTECKLFPLNGGDAITMTGLPGAGGVDISDQTVKALPKYKDYNGSSITPATAATKSVATMTFSTGIFSMSVFANGMKYTTLQVPSTGGDITIAQGTKSFVVPKGSEVDVINLPFSVATGVLGMAMGGDDHVHYFLYHKLADAEPPQPCRSPATVQQAMHAMGGPAGNEVSLSIACSNTNYP